MRSVGQDLGLLILRVGLGTIMFVHGAQKLFGWFDGPGPQGFVGWMGSLGIPAVLAWLAMLVEFAGGLAVILGLLARLAALGFAVNMLVAIFLVHWPAGFFMNWGNVPNRGEGWEFAFALLAASLALAFAGPGRYAAADLEPMWTGRRRP